MLCNDISMNAPRFCSECGSPTKPSYHAKIRKDGTLELEIVGYENIQEKIEAERPNTELSVLIAKYENGDLLALSGNRGFYSDVTKFPGSLTEAMNIIMNAEVEFAKLPVDVKQEFSNDWRKWLADFGSDNWNGIMKNIFDTKVEEKESEVKNDEE